MSNNQNEWILSKTGAPCQYCGVDRHQDGTPVVQYRIKESSCGGYDDLHLKCTNCGYSWWVDGDDG